MNTGLNRLHAWEEEGNCRRPEHGPSAPRGRSRRSKGPHEAPRGRSGHALVYAVAELELAEFQRAKEITCESAALPENLGSVPNAPGKCEVTPSLGSTRPPAHHVVSWPQPGKLACVVASDS